MATRGLSVTNQLRTMVLSGELGGRRRLSEIELANALGVSRTPIRAALSTLATEGFLTYTPNSGYVVKAFTTREIEDIYEVRGGLEGLSARLAAERGLPDDLRAGIAAVLAQGSALLNAPASPMRARFREINDAFHGLIFEASGNDFLRGMVRKTRDIPLLERLKYVAYDEDILARGHNDHFDLFDAILRRQGARAEALAREHVFRGAQYVIEHMRRDETRSDAA
jgi:GntR family transcriptional regulator of vanillate catabolism